ncbi:DNA adenine methylase [Helicobacter suis]|uniref:DNA adenine methylase n=1 Tax=Helicobacter suis TaxID=104628 RepID=UPI0013D173E7|nr:DNA adenine methylase [Helicobacter suis]
MLRSPQKIRVLPLKIQGIKSKIVPYIKELFRAWDMSGIYYEPFMGSGVVGFKTLRQKSHSSLAGGMNAPYP